MQICGVYLGKTKEIYPGLVSAIDKQAALGELWLDNLGLRGDEQADSRVHGGSERALHHYPAEHYAYWQQHFPAQAWQAPAFGENLSSLGLVESQVCIGDIFSWGEAVLQVSQPRSPCYRLWRRWNLAELPQLMQDNGRCGWLYRVLQPGRVSATARWQRLQGDGQCLSVAEALHHYLQAPLQRDGLQRLADCATLTPRWRQTAAERLRSGGVEDWQRRLTGVASEARQ